MDKTAFEVVPLDAPDDSVAYWQSRPYRERMQNLQILRRIAFGPRVCGPIEKVIDFARRESP